MQKIYQNLREQVRIFLDRFRGHTTTPTKTVDALTSVELADSTLQACQDFLKALVPSPAPVPIHPLIQYLPIMPLPVDPLATEKLDTGTMERWGDELQSLLRLYNVTTENNIPTIWRTVVPLSW